MISSKNINTKSREKSRSKSPLRFAAFRAFSRLNLLRFFIPLVCLVFVCPEISFSQVRKSKSKTVARKTQIEPKNQIVSKLPKVTQIDAEGLKKLLVPNGKPLLVNFWATWCDPCREEFPDLVKIGADYKDRIDLITVSLDDLAEIKRGVPKFLALMKSDSPAYLLKTPDEGVAIAVVSKDWQGGLPFTIIFNAQGETVYIKQGKFKTEFLRAEIDKIINKSNTDQQIVNLPNPQMSYTYEKGKNDARMDIANNKFIVRTYGLTPGTQKSSTELKEKYGIEIFDDSLKPIEYLTGYNEVSKAEIKRKFGFEF